jgi:hypothetical protein
LGIGIGIRWMKRQIDEEYFGKGQKTENSHFIPYEFVSRFGPSYLFVQQLCF